MCALYAGAQYTGIQRSSARNYQVKVVIHDVDLLNSCITGYLTIIGLAEKHSKLTTFFEGEIVGDKYSFLTRKWDATEKTDLDHWFKFAKFEAFRDTFNKENCVPDFSNADCLFMRWKEQFLVPDHKITNITGASYEGFYYVCFDKTHSKFEGYYYHASSEKFQRLEMSHTQDFCFPSYTLR